MLLPQKKLTMAFHMILPAIYALKCLIKYQPDIFYDTTGTYLLIGKDSLQLYA